MRARLLSLVLLATLTGLICQPAAIAMKLGSATSQFDVAAQDSVKLLRDFYQGLNDVERAAYIEKAVFDPSRKIGLIEDKERTGLDARFPLDGIQARVAVLQALATYTRGLMQLSSDAPVKSIESDIASTGSRLVAINADFNALTARTGDSSLKSFASPLSTLASLASKYWISAKRDVALRAAISESGDQVSKLFDLLEADVQEMQQGVNVRAANSSMGRYVDFYNREIRQKDSQDSGSLGESVIRGGRLQYLQDLKLAAIRYSSVDAANPVGLVKRMRAVHNDLVKCARSKKPQPSDVTGLLVDLESYSLEVNRVVSAGVALRKAIEQ